MMERSRRIPQLLALGTTVQLGIATLVWAVECNENNCPPGGCDVTGQDCNDNGVDDAVDIVNQFSEDCNLNRIPDECEFPQCAPIDGWVAYSAQARMISRGACPRFARTCHASAAKGQA